MKRIFYSLVLLTFFACTENEDISTPLDKKVQVEVEPLTLDESFTNIYGDIGANNLSTRVAIDYLRHPIQFNWSSGDKIGVFPLNAAFSNGVSAQAGFQAYNGVSTPTGDYTSVPFTEFNPEGFGLVNGCDYAAYYPYDPKNTRTDEIVFDYNYLSQGVEEFNALPVKDGEYILGRTQVQDHCYMIADAVKPKDDITIFHFEHVGAMVGFHLTFDDIIARQGIYGVEFGSLQVNNVKIWLIDKKGGKVKFPGYALGDLSKQNNRGVNVNLNSTAKVSTNDLDHLDLKIKKKGDGTSTGLIEPTLSTWGYAGSGDFSKVDREYKYSGSMDIMLWLYPQDLTDIDFLVIAECQSKSGQKHHYGTILKGNKKLYSGVAYAFNPQMHCIDDKENLATIFAEYNIINNKNAAAYLDKDFELYIGSFFIGFIELREK